MLNAANLEAPAIDLLDERPVAEGGSVSLLRRRPPRATRQDKNVPDARERPEDPAGTKPRHDPETLLPHERESLLTASQARESLAARARDGARADRRGAGRHALDAPAPHAARFQFVYGILIGVAIAALAAAVIAFSHNDGTQTIALSTWSHVAAHARQRRPDPADRRPRRARVPAAVGQADRRRHGRPVADRGHPARRRAAVGPDQERRHEHPREQEHRPLPHVRPGQGLLDQGGQALHASAACYLRREALELALYTFNYVADIDGVVVLMPPVAGQEAQPRRLLPPAGRQPSLQNPLVDTLPGPTPNVRTLMHSPQPADRQQHHGATAVRLLGHAGQHQQPRLPGARHAQRRGSWPGQRLTGRRGYFG